MTCFRGTKQDVELELPMKEIVQVLAVLAVPLETLFLFVIPQEYHQNGDALLGSGMISPENAPSPICVLHNFSVAVQIVCYTISPSLYK